MKNIICKLILLSCVLLTGCNAFSKAFANPNSGNAREDWDGNYKRMTGVGTGIDPQAQEIERRLGYSNEWF